MSQIALSIIIAFLWVLFQDEGRFKFSTFFSGYLIGLIVTYTLHRFFSDDSYIREIWAAIRFLGVYLYQLITSNISTINYILFKTKDMNPGLLSYETRLTSGWSITFLTTLVIITPGSIVIRIPQDSKKFFIHSVDVSGKEKDSLLRSIKHYEDLILEVSQ